MTLETFFEKFDLFADAPDAVAKMRELVLELAVQGKLSEQRDTDANDPAWLKLAEQLDAASDPSNPDIETPFEIPTWWRWTTLERLGDTKPRNDASDSTTSSFVPMTLIPAEYGQSARHESRPWGEIKKGYTHFQDGDVVMAKITPCFENGKSAVMLGLTGGFGAGTTELHVFRRSGDGVLAEFVIIYLKTRGFITRGEPRMTGSAGQKRVPYDYFARSAFPLPPLAEQKRIVAKVDELMALCDRLEAQQQEREMRHAALARASLARFADAPTPANLNLLFHSSFPISPSDLRKSILTLAVQGKLVPQDPNDEPAEELFARIENTKEKLIKQREIKRVALEPNPTGAECELLPPGWQWTRLGNSFDVRDGTHDTPKYTTEGFPLVTSKNIYSGSLLFEGANFISEKDHRQISERSRVDRGDILFAMIGSIGNPVIVDTDREFSIKNVALFKYYSAADSEPRFLLLYLKLVAEEMRAKAAGAVQSFVSLGFLRNYLFPLPPLAEQRRIVAKVSELMALVDELEKQLAASRAAAEKLLSALVAELTGTTSRLPADS
jgi:type I restriction enzyme S subunit